jgi:hypothetical protein
VHPEPGRPDRGIPDVGAGGAGPAAVYGDKFTGTGASVDAQRTGGHSRDARNPEGRRRSSGRGSRSAARRSGPRAEDPGADLERRVARVEFAEGALVRLRVPVRADAESGRDVLTDLDVIAIDVDFRLRLTRSILECKSGQGQAKEPDRLFWLAGLERFVHADRAALVRQTITRRGRDIAATLGLQVLDIPQLEAREAAQAWLPPSFAHVNGDGCTRLESHADAQVKALGYIPADLVAFLRHDALLAPSDRVLASLVTLDDCISGNSAVPEPAGTILAGHALIALLLAATADAHTLDVVRPDELLGRLGRSLTVGSGETQVLEVLNIADQLIGRLVEQMHEKYAEQGATRAEVTVPNLRRSVSDPPDWLPRYMNLLEALRGNPAVARDLLQTAELACFDALAGDSAYLSPAFDHLFTPEHRQLLRLAVRTLRSAVGPALADRLGNGFADINFERVPPALPDRRATQQPTQSTPTELALDPTREFDSS